MRIKRQIKKKKRESRDKILNIRNQFNKRQHFSRSEKNPIYSRHLYINIHTYLRTQTKGNMCKYVHTCIYKENDILSLYNVRMCSFYVYLSH